MPTYHFRCKACGEDTSTSVPISDEAPREAACTCGETARRVYGFAGQIGRIADRAEPEQAARARKRGGNTMTNIKITGCETAIVNDGQELHLDQVEADGPIIYKNGAQGSVENTTLTGKVGLISEDSHVDRRRVVHRPS